VRAAPTELITRIGHSPHGRRRIDDDDRDDDY
jgi:hypothetical protein